jgi:diphthine synthase
MLFLVGLGLNGANSLTLEGIQALKNCEYVYLENYTSLIENIKSIEREIGKKIKLANREMIENKSDEILKLAKREDVGIIVIGDVLSATTHVSLVLDAEKERVKVKIIHNASIINSISNTGLSLYKFGKISSISKDIESDVPYNIIKENKESHTLILLDLMPEEKKTITFSEAIKRLLYIEDKRKEKVFTKESLCLGCCVIGTENEKIFLGKAKDLMNKNIDIYPQCLVVVGKLHFVEEEYLEKFKV